MENKSHALIAGIFTLVLGMAVILSLYAFSGDKVEVQQVVVVTRGNVVGLNPQAQVRYRGIRVGKVLDIRLDSENVGNILILIEIERMVPLTHGTTARLSYQGITGIAQVLLEDDGSDPRVLSGVNGVLPRIAMQSSFLEDLGSTLPKLLVQTTELIEKTNDVLNDQNRQNIGKTLANMEVASRRVNSTLDQLDKLLSEENIHGLSGAVKEAAPLMADTRKLVVQLQGVSSHLEQVLDSASTGGMDSLGPSIREMTTELTSTSRQLSRVLNLLETSPQSLLFGAPPVQAGPGEPGFNPSAAGASGVSESP